MTPRPRSPFLLTLALLLPALPTLAQTPDKPAWHCLPEQTVFSARVPDGKAFVEAFRNDTKLGTVLLSEQRIAKIGEMIEQEAGDEWSQMSDELEKYNLSLEEWPELFNGDMGFGLVLIERPRDRFEYDGPLMVVLGWVEPGEDLATRLHEGMLRAIEDQAAEGEEVEREDFELAGRPVNRLSFPEQGLDYEADWQMPDNFFEMTEEQQEAHWEQVQRRAEEAESVELDRTHLLVARMGGRLVFAMSPPQSQAAVRALRDGEQDIPWDEVTGLAQVTETFARFLAAHDDDEPRYAQRILATPGLAGPLPEGIIGFEMHGDIDPLMRLIRAEAQAQDELEEFEQIFGMVGLSQGHAGAYRMTLDGTILRGGLFFGLPAPRAGLISLLDQQPLESRPPAWVSADVIGYAHLAFDLAEAYAKSKEMAIQTIGPEAAQGFNEAEMQFLQFTQVELPAVLASLGRQHTTLNFGVRMAEVEMPDWSAEPDPQTGQFPTQTVKQPQQRVAFVWQLSDEAVWQKLFQVINNFAAMSGGNVMKAVEEQGFNGFRWDQMGNTGGLMLGKGRLVLAIGEEVLAPTLSMLSAPPEEAHRLVNSPAYEETRQMLDLGPGLVLSMEDTSRSMPSAMRMVHTMFESNPALDDQFMKWVDALLPTAKEIEDTSSINAGVVYMTDEGIVMETAYKLTPVE